MKVSYVSLDVLPLGFPFKRHCARLSLVGRDSSEFMGQLSDLRPLEFLEWECLQEAVLHFAGCPSFHGLASHVLQIGQDRLSHEFGERRLSSSSLLLHKIQNDWTEPDGPNDAFGVFIAPAAHVVLGRVLRRRR
jgi:hypothetical protein